MTNDEQHLRTLTAALADPKTREEAAKQLAEAVGARQLFGLLADAELDGEFVPAPGFIATLPGGPGWDALLTRAKTPGYHSEDVELERGGDPQPALTYTHTDFMLVFGGGHLEPEQLDPIIEMVPLLASMLRAEYAEFITSGKLHVARQAAQQASALANALERSRFAREQVMTDLEEQARKLEKARATAVEALRVKDEFLAMLGHELRNPLAPIATAIDVMRLKGLDHSEIDIIDRQVNHMTRLVDDLLDVSRITRGKIELRKQRIELAEVAARAAEMASPLLEDKRQRLSVDIASTGLVVNVDPARFAQVISNLLTNAAKFSPEEASIHLEAERDGDFAALRVIDEGVGLSADALDTIFDRFVQTTQGPDRAQGGLGLGLAIVKSIVDMHGGTVSAHSDGVDCGSEFVVRIPLVANTAVADSDRQDRQDALDAGLRILVVDDNQDSAARLAQTLEAYGYVTCTAFDGPTALSLLEQFQPDVVLIDIGLPVMDGYELAERLRDAAEAQSLRLVAVSGYGQPVERQRCLEAGFDAYRIKPLDSEEVKQLIDELVARSSAHGEELRS